MSDAGGLRYRIRRRTSDPEGALVLWHGRGADENDLFSLLDFLDPPGRLLGVTPRGPLALPPGGAHWYEAGSVGYPDPGSFNASFELVAAWLDGFIGEAGIPIERTLLGGFSQGGVMTYATGLGSKRPRPAGLLVFSGFMPRVDGFELDLNGLEGFPVAIGHGTQDPIIGVEWGREARDRLTQAAASVAYRESRMAHAIDPGWLEELVPWIASSLPGS